MNFCCCPIFADPGVGLRMPDQSAAITEGDPRLPLGAWIGGMVVAALLFIDLQRRRPAAVNVAN